MRPLNPYEKVRELVEHRLAGRLGGPEFIEALEPVRVSLQHAAENLEAIQFPANFEDGLQLQEFGLTSLDFFGQALEHLSSLEHEVDAELAHSALELAGQAYGQLEEALKVIQLRRMH